MSKRILILTGSPRRGGNSDLMADAFAKGASEAGNSVVQFNTAHKHIQGCRACDNCFSKLPARKKKFLIIRYYQEFA